MKYRREIDGLRAVAVLPVVLFHAGVPGFSGGFVGVDVFFVISGFLLTTIIVDEMTAGTFSIKTFYEKRARRILPALVFVAAACVPAAWILMNEYELGQFAETLLGLAVFASNYVLLAQEGYFEEASDFDPLVHTWSLAVEEQFYIFYPILPRKMSLPCLPPHSRRRPENTVGSAERISSRDPCELGCG